MASAIRTRRRRVAAAGPGRTADHPHPSRASCQSAALCSGLAGQTALVPTAVGLRHGAAGARHGEGTLPGRVVRRCKASGSKSRSSGASRSSSRPQAVARRGGEKAASSSSGARAPQTVAAATGSSLSQPPPIPFLSATAWDASSPAPRVRRRGMPYCFVSAARRRPTSERRPLRATASGHSHPQPHSGHVPIPRSWSRQFLRQPHHPRYRRSVADRFWTAMMEVDCSITPRKAAVIGQRPPRAA
jgi:hypothetical protein